MKWCLVGSEVDICRTDWSRAGEKETEGEKRIGGFRAAARVRLRAADMIVIPRDSLGAARSGPKWQTPGPAAEAPGVAGRSANSPKARGGR